MPSDLNDDDKLNIFLHEVAHHKYGHAQPKPENFAEIAAYIERPENNVGYQRKENELRARGFALAARELIDEASYYDSWNPELKLTLWLKSF